MKAFNKRLNHKTEVRAIDFDTKKVKLVQPNSKPTFIYTEKLDNVTLLEATGVTIDKEDIYVGDTVISSKNDKFIVQKIPGGYLPFAMPIKETFRKVK